MIINSDCITRQKTVQFFCSNLQYALFPSWIEQAQLNESIKNCRRSARYKPTFWSALPQTCGANVNFGWKLNSNTSWRFAGTRDKAPLFGAVGAEERRVEPGREGWQGRRCATIACKWILLRDYIESLRATSHCQATPSLSQPLERFLARCSNIQHVNSKFVCVTSSRRHKTVFYFFSMLPLTRLLGNAFRRLCRVEAEIKWCCRWKYAKLT